jgi:hypothetical protein
MRIEQTPFGRSSSAPLSANKGRERSAEMGLIIALLAIASSLLLISWGNVFNPNKMSRERKLFINEMIRSKAGSSIGSIEGFVIGTECSGGKRALAIILVLLLLPVWIALLWILGIPGVIYTTYKNVKYQPIRSMGLTSFGILVAYAAPFLCFPLVPGMIMIQRLIIAPLYNRIGIGRMIIARTKSSYLLLPILEEWYFNFGKPSIIQLSDCRVSLVSREPKKTKIEVSIGSDKRMLAVLKGQTFSNVPEMEAVDVVLVK